MSKHQRFMDLVHFQKNNPRKLQASVFFILLALAFIAFRNCFSIDIPTDSYSLLFSFQQYGASGLLHNFYDVGMYPFADSIIFLLYKIIGVNSACWIISSIVLHTLNSFLVWKLGTSLLRGFNVKHFIEISFLASLIFLLSPFQTEVVLWVPRMFNYQITTALFIAAFYFLSEYLLHQKKKDSYLLHLFFILAILSYEASLIFPAVGICTFIFFSIALGNSFPLKKFIVSVLAPQVLIVAGYFSACKLWLGNWILHYGAATHLNFPLQLIIGNYVKYFTKFFLFWRYLPKSRGEWLHNMHLDVKNPLITVLLLLVVVSLLGFVFFRLYKKEKTGVLLCLMLFFVFMASLLPVINLDTSFVGVVISDRYGYLPSVSFYLFLVLFINLLMGKAGKIISVVLICTSFFLLSQTISQWTESDNYTKRLIKNFEPLMNTKENIYVLNMPDNYNWILTFRNGFGEYFALKYGHDLRNKVIPVASFFMKTGNDSITVLRKSETEFVVSSTDGQQCFLHDGTWGGSYETPDHSVEFSNDNSSYILKMKKPLDGSKIIYVAGAEWKEINP